MKCYTQQKVLKRVTTFFLYKSTYVLKNNSNLVRNKTYQKKAEEMQREKTDLHSSHTQFNIKSHSDLVLTKGKEDSNG